MKTSSFGVKLFIKTGRLKDVDSDEVVLSWKDCYWWGRCTISQPLVLDGSIIAIFTEVNPKSASP